MFECFYTVYLFLSIYRKWTNDLNRRYDPAVAGNNKIFYKREHLGLVQCIVIFFSDQLTHLIQVNFNSLQWVILGQTLTGVEPNEGALRLLHRVKKLCLPFTYKTLGEKLLFSTIKLL